MATTSPVFLFWPWVMRQTGHIWAQDSSTYLEHHPISSLPQLVKLDKVLKFMTSEVGGHSPAREAPLPRARLCNYKQLKIKNSNSLKTPITRKYWLLDFKHVCPPHGSTPTSIQQFQLQIVILWSGIGKCWAFFKIVNALGDRGPRWRRDSPSNSEGHIIARVVGLS